MRPSKPLVPPVSSLLSAGPTKTEETGPLTYFVFVLLGMATLFPWNAFLNAFEYFKYSLAGTPYEYSFMRYVVTAYTSIMLVMMVATVLFKMDQGVSVTAKGFIGLGLNLLLISLMTLIPVADVINGSSILGRTAFFWIVLGIVSGTALSTALMMKSFYALISLYPPKYVPAFNGGQAVSGVLISIVSLLSQLISAQSQSDSIMLKSVVFYFSASSIILVVSLFGFYWLSKQDSYRGALTGMKVEHSTIGKNLKTFRIGIQAIWNLCISLMMVLTVTIAIISSCITQVKSSGSGVWARVFRSVAFLMFNIGDVVGRWLSAVPTLTFRRRSRKPQVIPWLRLIVFLPLFLMSNMDIEPKHLGRILPTLIKSDWLYLIVSFSFGMTGGFAATSLMIAAPDQTQRRFIENELGPIEELEAAKGHSGSIMGLFINIGLVLGSLGSFIIRAIV